jgi:hypothetical protein
VLFLLFICFDPAKQKNTDSAATISIMFGRRGKEHNKDFFENILKGIESSEIINRGLFTAYIIVCFALESSYEKCAYLLREVGNSIIIE